MPDFDSAETWKAAAHRIVRAAGRDGIVLEDDDAVVRAANGD